MWFLQVVANYQLLDKNPNKKIKAELTVEELLNVIDSDGKTTYLE